MRFIILTLFPEVFESFLSSSILKRAIGKEIIEVKLVNIRDYTKDKYNRCDTPPVGGGAGLILKIQPIIDALKANSSEKTHKIILSPRGIKYDQKIANHYAKDYEEILILCGHYEGFDERIYDYFDEVISIGDYILTGGEPAALAIIDSVSRLIKGVITESSLAEESFSSHLLEYPQYTEPYEYDNKKIPDILYSGNHQAIEKYRLKKSLDLTLKLRKDLLNGHIYSKTEEKLIEELKNEKTPDWELEALNKGKKFIK